MSERLIVQRDGFRLSASVSGQGRGAPWLILSNSLGAATMMWTPQRTLLESRFRVLSYDARGHGDSDAPPGPYSFDDLEGDVIAIMDCAEIATATFMGLSLGGMTGLGLTISYPDRFDRMVCCDARADAPPDVAQGWNNRIKAVGEGGLSAILAPTLERWFVESWRKAHPDAVARFEKAFLATSQEGYRGCAEALKKLDYFKSLGQIGIPILYVVGERDVAAPPSVMRAMAAATPGSRFVEIPDAAHLANVDNAAAFNAAITPFLGLA